MIFEVTKEETRDDKRKKKTKNKKEEKDRVSKEVLINQLTNLTDYDTD